MIKAFDKIGFATDPLYGNLTVSPQHLGTALSLECKFNANIELLDSKLQDIETARCVKIIKSQICISMVSDQTLAPKKTETSQILDFLTAAHDICN